MNTFFTKLFHLPGTLQTLIKLNRLLFILFASLQGSFTIMKLKYFNSDILEYYDVPQLLVARDQCDKPWLCLLLGIVGNGDLEFLCVEAPMEDIDKFRNGQIDLRSLILENLPAKGWYDGLESEAQVIDLTFVECPILDSYLPDEGYFHTWKNDTKDHCDFQ